MFKSNSRTQKCKLAGKARQGRQAGMQALAVSHYTSMHIQLTTKMYLLNSRTPPVF